MTGVNSLTPDDPACGGRFRPVWVELEVPVESSRRRFDAALAYGLFIGLFVVVYARTRRDQRHRPTSRRPCLFAVCSLGVLPWLRWQRRTRRIADASA
jgi:hypothetical protein